MSDQQQEQQPQPQGPASVEATAGRPIPAPSLDGATEWLNVASPIALSQLGGKVVLLDFWTYGCINCMHILRDLKTLEERFADELVVIGVHSPKFTNERSPATSLTSPTPIITPSARSICTRPRSRRSPLRGLRRPPHGATFASDEPPMTQLLRTLLVALACVLAACRPAPLPAERAIVILVSIDGFRWDYLDRHQAPNLARLAAQGVRAERLIPQFPSKTFPNHYTIVTGLRLANHGIISNNMRAADIPGEFSLSNRDVLADSRWWGGEPIWNTAEKQGRIAAAMFWPGSETVISGRQATFWKPFDDDLPHPERVGQVLAWLKLPDGRRPSFLTLYYSEVDNAGHDDGPESQAVNDAVRNVDRSLGELVAGVNDLGLADRVHYIVLSDHGMAALSPDRMIVLDNYVNVAAMDVVDWAPVLGLAPKDGNVEKLYAALKDKHPHLAVYRKNEIPAEYGISGHPRLPAVIGIADEGWFITSQRDVDRWGQSDRRPPGGTHGYDARAKSMHGLFVAAGPRIKSGLIVKPFENIHVYDFMCAVMGLTPAKNDGDPAVTRDMLR